nr:cystatin 3 [Saccharum hybrid cultivar SP70-1143]
MRVAATRLAAAPPPLPFLLLLVLLGSAPLAIGAAMAGHVLGGVKDNPAAANSAESDGLGRFAVDEHNKRENALLEFVRVVEAKEQVVAGTLHHLTLEAIEAGKKKLYEAKVWVKPWLDFKELQDFSHKGEGTTFTNADLGAKKGGHEPGWREVPVEDPVVKDLAHHAVKSIQERSNSLFPYELLEIVWCQGTGCGRTLQNLTFLMKLEERQQGGEDQSPRSIGALEGGFCAKPASAGGALLSRAASELDVTESCSNVVCVT